MREARRRRRSRNRCADGPKKRQFLPGAAGGAAIEQERRGKGRDTGAGTDHDDRCLRILRQSAKIPCAFWNIDFYFIAGIDAFGEKSRQGRAD